MARGTSSSPIKATIGSGRSTPRGPSPPSRETASLVSAETAALFIADTSNQRIRKVDASGIITTVAGNGTFRFNGDGGPATDASLANPFGVAVDGAGTVFIADFNNQRIRRVRFDPSTLIDNLIQQVMNLNLQQGIENSLDSKLEAVQNALDDITENNDIAAINSLDAFISAVGAQRDNKIPEADADALVAAAQTIIAALWAG